MLAKVSFRLINAKFQLVFALIIRDGYIISFNLKYEATQTSNMCYIFRHFILNKIF